jgi:hypothetical protein
MGSSLERAQPQSSQFIRYG